MKKQFPASTDSLEQILEFVRNEAVTLQFKRTYKLEIAVEEAVSNVMRYSGSHFLMIECSQIDQQGIRVTIQDQGIPYNPLTNSEKNDGYGIYLLVKLMDHVEYYWKDEQNTLVLTKKID